jgi:PTS system sucrose-specific IIC component
MYLLAKKHSKDRDIAMSSFIPTLVGISEPAIFAANLKYSVIPFVCSCLGAGCGGAFMKLAGVRAIGQGLTGILGLLIVVPNKLVFYVIGNLIAFIVPIVLIVIYNKTKGVPHGEEEEEAESALTIDETAKVPVKAVVDGKVIAIEDVKDGIFSEKVLGDGVGIIPTSETVLAPAEGEICTVMEGSKHAIGVRTTNNSVFLIHVGIETVSMNGEGFEYLVKKGQYVKEGQPILKFDKAKIEAKGLNPVVVFVKTDEGNQTPVAFKTGINVKAGKDVIGE